MNTLLTLSICILFSVGASVFLKLGTIELNETINLSSIIKNPMIWAGGFCYFSAFLGYIYLLRLLPLSLAQPIITAGVSIMTTLIAVLYIRELMSLINWFGLLLICSGIFLLFLGRV